MDQHNSFEFFEDDDDDHQKIDLIEIQKQSFTHIFNLGLPSGIESHSHSHDDEDNEVEIGDGLRMDKRILAFKVLVYDQQASNILANIMKVGALRDCNITLHLNINSKREQIPDMPAIYLLCKYRISPYLLPFDKLIPFSFIVIYFMILI